MPKKQSDVKLRFTTIQHDPRLKFELSNNEYCVADAVYHLSHNPSSIVVGWCFASRKTIGEFFGFSRQSTIKIIQTLTIKRLIEVDHKTSFLRTTQLWYDEFVNYRLIQKKNNM